MDAYKKNYENKPNAVRPTLQDLLDLKANKQKQMQKRDTSPNPAELVKRGWWDYNYQYCRKRNWYPGCQVFYPFTGYGWVFDYDLSDYYTCFDSYVDCDDWDGDCDCDWGYC